MSLATLLAKGEGIWSVMPEFGEPSKPATTTQGENMAVDPQWIAAGSNVLGAALGGSTSSSASQYTNFNNSGYTVATSGSKADGSPSIPWYVWVIAGVAVIKIFKRKKA